MAGKTENQFGKRKPPAAEATEAAPASKRSGQVALVLMGALAVGGTAYALMPSEKCNPNDPRLTAEQRASCQRSSGSSWSGSSRSGYYGGSSHGSDSSGHSSSGLSVPTSHGSQTTRGGFGSFGRAIAASFSRGG